MLKSILSSLSLKIGVICLVVLVSTVFSQENEIVVGPRGQVTLSTEVVDDFEDANRWYGQMFIDDGLIQVLKRKGFPRQVKESNPENSNFVLGAKVNFFKRKFSEALIKPPSETRIGGFVKKISLWAVGVQQPHEVFAVIRDFKGNNFEIKLGDLNYYGWRKLEAIIPESQEETSIVQDFVPNRTFYHRRGITFLGLRIKFYAFDAVGSTYFYFDQLEVEADVYLENQERDNMNLSDDEREIPLNNW